MKAGVGTTGTFGTTGTNNLLKQQLFATSNSVFVRMGCMDSAK
jgi:hypothetical protein